MGAFSETPSFTVTGAGDNNHPHLTALTPPLHSCGTQAHRADYTHTYYKWLLEDFSIWCYVSVEKKHYCVLVTVHMCKGRGTKHTKQKVSCMPILGCRLMPRCCILKRCRQLPIGGFLVTSLIQNQKWPVCGAIQNTCRKDAVPICSPHASQYSA